MTRKHDMTEKLKPETVRLDLRKLCYGERGNTIYGFDAFKKGQSVLIKERDRMIRTRNAAYTYMRRWNLSHKIHIEFRCVKSEEEGGWRLIRTR
jgi:hypothetical protein